MLFNHSPAAVSYTFDEPNLVSAAGLVPAMALAQNAGLTQLAQRRLTVANTGADKGANAGAKISSLVAGMVAGADSIDDMDLLRHGGMKHLFDQVYAPSTLGSHLRAYTFGHVRQLDAVASRFLTGLGSQAPLLPVAAGSGSSGMVFVDIDDTVIDVHSAAKQGAGFGYQGTRGLNALLATASTTESSPVVVAQRLRKGAVSSARGANRLISDALSTVGRVDGQQAPVVVRADSAYYNAKVAKAVISNGAELSVTVRMDTAIKRAIRTIPEHGWTGIKYPQAIFDEGSGTWISEAEVAEVEFTVFTSKKKEDQVSGRLIVRRVPEKNSKKLAAAGQDPLFETYRHHGFFTTIDAETLDTVAADKMHRGHAIIEQINAELKAGPLAHMPSGVFNANAAWLTIAAMAHNLIRVTATILGGKLARARAHTIRTKILAVPARIAHRARKLILHLPLEWKWEEAFKRLWRATLSPPNRPSTT